MTRYVVVGAGAIGGAVGGLLARAGSEVLLIARGDHGRAMIDNGLTLRCPDGTFTVDAPAATGPDNVRLRVDDVLVLATKTHQAESAINQWADVPVFDGDRQVGRAADVLPVLTALNGVASEDIALRYFERVFAVCVWFPAVMIEPGEVIVRGAPLRGVFHIGPYHAGQSGAGTDDASDAALLATVQADWAAAGCKVVLSDNVMAWKYRKLLGNLGNAFQALLGDTSGADDLVEAARAEARDILAAAEIDVTPDEVERAARQDAAKVRPVPGVPEQLGGSSWQSLIRGSGTIETDYLNGEIALIGRRIGHPAPINSRVTALARHAARTGLRPGELTADRLRAELTR
ncbi:ketopantoate reductase family protein [Microlunatus sp. Gsoil 973]|uniref:ketopantoate reductase family protein n=1 Tax=Microlunatus sp. Gsoil 973 TaxID=2672569 RepID=UPI0012B4752A|nr:2-dehydropantoate 2-reductase N-terminal domain-containing protein [Microlunatus sp. Gsoil 973]QGN33777.1 2-dehydropantoate 2-reductase [Microlunatus sp. Gsoil 973]